MELPAGRYRVTIQYKSFAPIEQDFTLSPGRNAQWDVRLQLEPASSNVIVTASAEPALAESTPDLVDVITREQIDQRQEIWLTDMLASQQGVTFSRLGAYGGITSFFLDGGELELHESAHRWSASRTSPAARSIFRISRLDQYRQD